MSLYFIFSKINSYNLSNNHFTPVTRPKCELPKLIMGHNIVPISAANIRLLLLGHCCRLHRSSVGPTKAVFFDYLNLWTYSQNVAQYRPYTKPIVTFTMASSFESRKDRVRPMDDTLLGHVSLLPPQIILEVRKLKFGTASAYCCAENKCIPELSFQQRHDIRNQSLAIFLPMLGQCWGVSKFTLGLKCELPKLIIRYNIVSLSAANSRLLLLGHCCRLHQSSVWPTTAAFVDCLNLPTFIRNLVQYWPYSKPIVTFTMESSSESIRARVRLMDGTLLGHVSLLPRQTILGVRKPEFGTALARCCAYRNYHSSNGTILATNLRQYFCRSWASVGQYLTSHLGPHSILHLSSIFRRGFIFFKIFIAN